MWHGLEYTDGSDASLVKHTRVGTLSVPATECALAEPSSEMSGSLSCLLRTPAIVMLGGTAVSSGAVSHGAESTSYAISPGGATWSCHVASGALPTIWLHGQAPEGLHRL